MVANTEHRRFAVQLGPLLAFAETLSHTVRCTNLSLLTSVKRSKSMNRLPILLMAVIYCFTAWADVPSYDAELSQFKYPFEVQRFELKTQQQHLTMAYMDVAAQTSTSIQGPAKPAVLLLHGKNFAGYYWQRIATDLSARGYRIIIPDQIGFGKSAKPAHYQYSFAQLALNTHQLLQRLKVAEVIVVGHSMGGMLATHYSHFYPNDVTQLILINPIGLENYLAKVEIKDSDFFYANELNKTLAGARSYQQKNYYDGQWSEVYEALLVPLKGQLQHADWPRVAWNNALTYGPVFNEPIVDVLGKIQQPTTLIIGSRDRTGPGRGWKKDPRQELGRYDLLGKQAAAVLQKGKLYELDGLGHMPQFEDYARFSAVFYPLFEAP